MTAKHTPGPWSFGEYTGSEDDCYIKGGETRILGAGKKLTKNNAEFIVRACNSHYDLLEALEAMLTVEEDLLAEDHEIDDAVMKAKAAIAKAKNLPQ